MGVSNGNRSAAGGGDPDPSSPGPGRFQTTRWTMVCHARDRSDPGCSAALNDLCRTYWYPLYAYVRRRGYAVAEAEDLTQEFFYRLLSKDYLRSADPAKGRFRTFLLVAMKRFLAKEWRSSQAAKRGGGRALVPIDSAWAESTYRHEPVDKLTPEMVYERRWAMSVLEQALETVRKSMEQADKQALFEALKHTLIGDPALQTYVEVARDLNMTEEAVKSAAHRLRRRCGDELRVVIAETVKRPEEIEEELRHLFSIFAD